MEAVWAAKALLAALLAAGATDARAQRELVSARAEVAARQRAAISSLDELRQMVVATTRHAWTPELRQLWVDALGRERQAMANLMESKQKLEQAEAAVRPALVDAGG